MLYDTKSPKVIGAKSESITTHNLYHLNADGTVDSEHLVTLSNTNYHNSSYNFDYDDDDDDTAVAHHYARVLLNQNPYSVDVTGAMVSLVEASSDEEYEEEIVDIEFMEEMVMPSNVEEDLREYIREKLDT